MQIPFYLAGLSFLRHSQSGPALSHPTQIPVNGLLPSTIFHPHLGPTSPELSNALTIMCLNV